MDECFEVDGDTIVSSGDAAEVFELVKAAFDSIPRLVDFEVVGDQALAGWVAGNDGGGADVGGDQYSQQLEAMNTKRADLLNEAAEAYRQAKSHLASAGNSSPVTSFGASIDAAIAALDAAGGGLTLGLQGQGDGSTQSP